MDVGFVGLGNMGAAMAGNLIKAGHRVRVWNRSPGPAQELAKAGAQAVEAVRDAFRGDAVLSMLANDDAVRSAILGSDALADAPRGLVHVNMATVSVAFAQDLIGAHQQRGIAYVAAPVFGRPDVAAAGRLNIVAAGPTEALDRVRPLFDAIGQKTWTLGDDPIAANIAKVAGNFMLGCALEAMAEASALVKAHGIEPARFLDIMTNTLFAAPAYKSYAPLIAEQRFRPAGFKLALGLKDMRLALAAAETARVPLPAADLVRNALLEAVAAGEDDVDWAVLAKIALRRAGLA